ncbi:hypothetical protein BDZ97DRAFT_2054993 [Flammula alnicola]|nr:hypothetical protein BDZ97DRAFT_2054993 [Flammula alnicola]
MPVWHYVVFPSVPLHANSEQPVQSERNYHTFEALESDIRNDEMTMTVHRILNAGDGNKASEEGMSESRSGLLVTNLRLTPRGAGEAQMEALGSSYRAIIIVTLWWSSRTTRYACTWRLQLRTVFRPPGDDTSQQYHWGLGGLPRIARGQTIHQANTCNLKYIKLMRKAWVFDSKDHLMNDSTGQNWRRNVVHGRQTGGKPE